MTAHTLPFPFLLTTLCLAPGTLLSAHAGPNGGVMPDSTLATAVVTGTRSPRRIAESPVQTRVITGEDIRRADATDLRDVLTHELPGLEFTQAMSGHTYLNVGGFGGQGVLILVNGERLAGETMDNVDFARLEMVDVERIEVVRGAASALYGSSAAGGVINIITRQKVARPCELRIEMHKGRHDETRQNAFFGIERGKFTQLFTASRTASDEYRLYNPNDVTQHTKYSINRVAGGRTFQAKERLVFRPDAAWTFSGNAGYFFRQRDFDPGERNRYRDFAGGLRGEWNSESGARGELAYRFDQYDKSDFYPATRLDVRDYSNVRHNVRALFVTAPLDLGGSMLTLTGGADADRDYLLTYQFRGRARRQFTADAYAQADIALDRHWEFIATARYDYFSVGQHGRITPKIAARYRNGNLTLRGGYGQGFRAPTLKEKYMDFFLNDIFIIRGLEQLRPEVSHNWHLSADWAKGSTELSAALAYNRVHDRITTAAPTSERDAASGLPYVNYINVARLNVWNAQFGVTHRRRCLDGVLAGSLQYAFTHEQTRAAGTLTPYMPARPHSATARLSFDRRFTTDYSAGVQLSARCFSALSGMEYNTVTGEARSLRYPAYALLRLMISQQFGRAVRFSLTADNLLDYRPHIYYYNAPLTDGLHLSLGISVDVDRLF